MSDYAELEKALKSDLRYFDLMFFDGNPTLEKQMEDTSFTSISNLQLSPEGLGLAFDGVFIPYEEAYAMNSEWDRKKQAVADGVTRPMIEGAL